ncbi:MULTISPECIES: porin [Rhizobium/Agrobacterium group]|uniref:porin n=1 Tax=Rhizobium/Agrobacterium group TaxID=227290 RepID=UPI0023003910|nr:MULTISPECIES: porin [Rhizobium/Agrobacterium group]MDA5633687.1 porin [Agrobacterium sp. ST15.16.024]MDF1889333.1 porin [Rhizobium rhizogenes]
MNIKSFLIGSTAALAAVSGAQAADAIVATEPEALEYVRVCDAFGTGFFYIPGTETCLKFGGYIRFQTSFGRDKSDASDWNSVSRAQFEVDTRTDTELGALRGFIGLRGDADKESSRGVNVDQAFIELGGLKVGQFYNWWDDGLSGEADTLSTNAKFNSIRYVYDTGSFWGGVSLDELEGTGSKFVEFDDERIGSVYKGYNHVGISAGLGAKFGAATLQLIGGYDTDQEEGAIRLIATADVGPGTFGLAGVWASGVNAYYAESEWAVAAEYAVKATDKLTITPGVQYSGNIAYKGTAAEFAAAGGLIPDSKPTDTYYGTNYWSDVNAWKVGVTVDYKITEGLSTKVAVNYEDFDIEGGELDARWTGFVRLQRSF